MRGIEKVYGDGEVRERHVLASAVRGRRVRAEVETEAETKTGMEIGI